MAAIEEGVLGRRDRGVAVHAVPVAPGSLVRGEGAVGDAVPVRRPRRAPRRRVMRIERFADLEAREPRGRRGIRAPREAPRPEPFHVALSGGSTPRRMHEILAAMGRDALPWDRVVLWWGDERTVPPDHARLELRDGEAHADGSARAHPLPPHGRRARSGSGRGRLREAARRRVRQAAGARPDLPRPRTRRPHAVAVPRHAGGRREPALRRRESGRFARREGQDGADHVHAARRRRRAPRAHARRGPRQDRTSCRARSPRRRPRFRRRSSEARTSRGSSTRSPPRRYRNDPRRRYRRHEDRARAVRSRWPRRAREAVPLRGVPVARGDPRRVRAGHDRGRVLRRRGPRGRGRRAHHEPAVGDRRARARSEARRRRSKLLNDLQATALGTLALPPEGFAVLQAEAQPRPARHDRGDRAGHRALARRCSSTTATATSPCPPKAATPTGRPAPTRSSSCGASCASATARTSRSSACCRATASPTSTTSAAAARRELPRYKGDRNAAIADGRAREVRSERGARARPVRRAARRGGRQLRAARHDDRRRRDRRRHPAEDPARAAERPARRAVRARRADSRPGCRRSASASHSNLAQRCSAPRTT